MKEKEDTTLTKNVPSTGENSDQVALKVEATTKNGTNITTNSDKVREISDQPKIKEKFQDTALTENVPSTGENSDQAALKVEATTKNGTSITTNSDKVREILGQPKMTPEERERKRKELIEKQKEARQRAERISNEKDITVTNANVQPTQQRENLILQAVKFLSSPQVRNSDDNKKIKFLLGKGLTQKEIDIAFARSADNGQPSESAPQDADPRMDSLTTTQSPIAPPVPSRTYQTAMTRTPLWKRLTIVLLITGAFSVTMIAVIKKFLGPAITAIIFARQQLYSHQLNLFRKFNESLSTVLSLRKSASGDEPVSRSSVNDDDEPAPYEIEEISTLPSLLAPLATDLSELTEKLDIHQQNLAKYDTMPSLQLSLTSLATYLSSSVYSFSPWSNDRDSSVSQVRSEIRSLKGWLINRRNFPKIPLVPTYSVQSQQSSSQPQQLQQVNISNEEIE